MKVVCPKCHLEFNPDASRRYVVIHGRDVNHTLHEGEPNSGKYGKTLCGKLVDYNRDSITVDPAPAHENCSICQKMNPVLENPDQGGLFDET